MVSYFYRREKAVNKEIVEILIEAGVIPPCDAADVLEKLHDYIHDKATAEEIRIARGYWEDDDCRIDDDATVSRGEKTWVSAWVLIV